MARGDPILCQDPGDVLQFANQVRHGVLKMTQGNITLDDSLENLSQTRSEALVALFDDTLALKHAMWIDPGQESQGIAAMSGDTFSVANEVSGKVHT